MRVAGTCEKCPYDCFGYVGEVWVRVRCVHNMLAVDTEEMCAYVCCGYVGECAHSCCGYV